MIGIHKTNEDELFRQGIAFSLQRSQALPSIDPLLPKIEKFNEYLRYNPGAFSDFGMYYGERRSEFRSDIYTPTIITPEKVHEGVFIFMGTFAPLDQIDIDWILDDFDRLMPLYEYVEGTEKFPRTARRKKSAFSFTPGNAARKTQSSYQRKAASVDKELRHTLIQNALFKYLESLHGEDNTSGEQNTGNGTLIDVAVRTKHGHEYYEIKTALSAQGCIRDALGQLMEYAFWPGAQEAQKLIQIIGGFYIIAVIAKDGVFEGGAFFTILFLQKPVKLHDGPLRSGLFILPLKIDQVGMLTDIFKPVGLERQYKAFKHRLLQIKKRTVIPQ